MEQATNNTANVRFEPSSQLRNKTLRVMTYNTHSCRGTDGKVSPARTAEVIAEESPDIIALQELDSGLIRSGRIDQAEAIATELKMHFHFHPSTEMHEGLYGNAIITRFHATVIRAGELPTLPGRRELERRGALTVSISPWKEEGPTLSITTTHLGLAAKERTAQALELLGPDWLRELLGAGPAIVCGDFNAVSPSSTIRQFRKVFHEAHGQSGILPGTYPVCLPLLRLDRIFYSEGIRVVRTFSPRNPLTRIASDHYPFIADLAITSGENEA